MNVPRVMKISRLIRVVATYAMDIAHSASPKFPTLNGQVHYRFYVLVDNLERLLEPPLEPPLNVL